MTTIPQTAAEFKAWADRECSKWPMELTAQAYRTWLSMEGGSNDKVIQQFQFELQHKAWFEQKFKEWEARRATQPPPM